MPGVNAEFLDTISPLPLRTPANAYRYVCPIGERMTYKDASVKMLIFIFMYKFDHGFYLRSQYEGFETIAGPTIVIITTRVERKVREIDHN